MAELSVIIATINDAIATNMTMAQIIQQGELDNLDYEIIVVDNGSDEVNQTDLQEFLKYHKDFPIKYFYYPEPKGTIPPHSYGVLQTEGRYITMPDPHMVFSPHYFKRLIESIKKHNCEVVFTPFAVGAICKRNQGYVGGTDLIYPNPFGKVTGIGFGTNITEKPFPVLANTLSSVILERSWMLKIGNMFPEAFEIAGGYCAESILIGLTTWMFGGRCMLQPDIVADHPVYARGKPHGRNTSMSLSMATGAYILGGEKYLTEVPLGYGDFEQEQLTTIRRLAVPAKDYVEKHTKYRMDEFIENWEEIKNAKR